MTQFHQCFRHLKNESTIHIILLELNYSILEKIRFKNAVNSLIHGDKISFRINPGKKIKTL